MLNKINNLNKITKHYLMNVLLVFIILCSISIMFFVQFKVDNLQDNVNKVDAKISALDDEIRVLEVEWVYLTRPARLRMLSEKYLNNNGYIASNQIKNTAKLQSYYIAKLRTNENVAINYAKVVTNPLLQN